MPVPRPTGNADWVVRASTHPFVQCLRFIRARSMRRAVPSRSFGDHPRVVCACGSESTLGWAASLSWAIDGATRALARTRRTNARAAVDSLRASPPSWGIRGAAAAGAPRGCAPPSGARRRCRKPRDHGTFTKNHPSLNFKRYESTLSTLV